MIAVGMRLEKQPSVSVSESIGLLSCTREEEGKQSDKRAVLVEAAVDGSLGFLHRNSLRVSNVVCHRPSAPLSPSMQRQI